MPSNPFDNPLFVPAALRAGGLFGFGILLVLFFARHDLKAGLSGELGKRAIGWLIIAPLFLLAVFAGGAVAALIVLGFVFGITREYTRVVGVHRDYALFLYALIPLTLAVAAFAPGLFFMLPAAVILALTLLPIFSGNVRDLYLQLSYAGRGYFYVVWSVAHGVLIPQVGGIGLLVLAGVGVAMSDVMQYTVGKLLGRHIISPNVNPRKAWEGLLGDFIGAGIAVALFGFALPAQFTPPLQVALGLLIGISAAWGDLASSLVKRAADTKDWGTLVPGHGGLMDRANSLIVALPVVYYFAYLVMTYGR